MSLRRNIIANYAGQLYVTLAGIVFLPVYVRLMGAEAFGLVGFFTMLQSWFVLLDMGLTPTMARETARFAGGAIDGQSLRRLLRSLEVIFGVVAVASASVLILASRSIATGWLKVEELPTTEVRRALMLMAIIVAVRWVTGLYKGAITGYERLVWLNILGVGSATARFGLVIPVLAFVSNSPTTFFSYQLAIALLEAVAIVWKTYALLPPAQAAHGSDFDLGPLREVLPFSLTIAFTGAVWVLITQTDKLMLSGMISLTAYAHFTLAVIVASGILQVSGPVSVALLPRLARLKSQGDDVALQRVYREATQLVVVLVAPVLLVLVVFPSQVLWAWTGDAGVSDSASTVLRLYATGNACMVFAAFGYYLQYAHGNLRLHLIVNAVFVVMYVPLLFFAVSRYGMIGAGYAWLLSNLLPLLAWMPVVHWKFLPGTHWRWLVSDIASAFVLPTAAALALSAFVTWPDSRVRVAALAVAIGACLLVASVLGSSVVRGMMLSRIRGFQER